MWWILTSLENLGASSGVFQDVGGFGIFAFWGCWGALGGVRLLSSFWCRDEGRDAADSDLFDLSTRTFGALSRNQIKNSFCIYVLWTSTIQANSRTWLKCQKNTRIFDHTQKKKQTGQLKWRISWCEARKSCHIPWQWRRPAIAGLGGELISPTPKLGAANLLALELMELELGEGSHFPNTPRHLAKWVSSAHYLLGDGLDHSRLRCPWRQQFALTICPSLENGKLSFLGIHHFQEQ